MRLLNEASPSVARTLARKVRLVAFDFDGVFTDNTVYVNQDGSEMVRCWRSDGLGLQRLTAIGVTCIIISTETNPVVSARARKLRLECHQGFERKVEALQQVVEGAQLDLSEVAFVGNDVNDAECLRAVGLPILVADAHADVLVLGLLQTETPGGRGAVREICDYLVAQQADH